MPYQSPYASEIARLMAERGRVAGDRALQRGQVLGGAVRSLASLLPQMQADRAAEQQAQRVEEERRARMDTDRIQRQNAQGQIDERDSGRKRAAQITSVLSADGDMLSKLEALKRVDPEFAFSLQESAAKATEAERKAYAAQGEAVSRAAGAVLQLPPAQRKTAWAREVSRLQKQGIVSEGELPAVLEDADIEPALHFHLSLGLTAKELAEMQQPEIAPAGSGIIRNGAIVGQVPFKPDAPPAVGSFEDYVVRAHGQNPTPAQIEAARGKYQKADDRPLAPIVIQTPTGVGLLDRSAQTVTPVKGADGQPIGPTPTEAQRNESRQYAKAKPILSAVSELSDRINTQQGAMAKVTGATERAKAQLNLNDDVAEYQSLISGFTPLIARALGHTGVLTEQDVQSVKAMFPKPGDSKSLRDRKVARIEQLMGAIEGAAEAPQQTPATGGWTEIAPGVRVREKR